jgi:multiple sugar transport system ATP-binding protein
MTLADRVVVMNHGRIEQVGAPHDLYHHPKTRFVAGFIGSPAMNFVPCRLEDNGGHIMVRVGNALAFPVPQSRTDRYRPHVANDKLLLGLRPEHIIDAKGHPGPGLVPFDAVLDVTEPMGMETLVYFDMNGTTVCGRVSPTAGARDGHPLRLAADLNNMHLIDGKTDAVL